MTHFKNPTVKSRIFSRDLGWSLAIMCTKFGDSNFHYLLLVIIIIIISVGHLLLAEHNVELNSTTEYSGIYSYVVS